MLSVIEIRNQSDGLGLQKGIYKLLNTSALLKRKPRLLNFKETVHSTGEYETQDVRL